MRVLYSLCIISILAITSSCSYKQSQLLFQASGTKPDSTAAHTSQTISGSPYRIHPLDQLQIRNLQSIKSLVDQSPAPNSNISGGSAAQGQIFQVEEDGTVALPEIGHVRVEGLTRVEATKLIEDQYKKNVLVNPVFEIKVINLKVTLFGEVKSQGNYPLVKDNTTLVELLGEAGGLTQSANEKSIKIIRGDANKTVTEIDLSKLSSISDPRAILQNGDVIYVSQNKRGIRSDNLQNITTLVQPVLLLVNTALVLLTLSRL
ncbi:polysaccharide biosynthesis/export family protein [Mucilaginibacter sp. ZB1P21]|uniref:Polysaccharide biosynthesis/export family protein n=2 Tax=Mucilaginibacter glaciei TaxID=2772109 RepID=A0A926S1K5_9SPHI|nr:polysaccharide biosynthesis/export family protein [Mucilaginibacter glaciei]